MANFKVVASKLQGSEQAGRSSYVLENEVLSSVGAEIVEIEGGTDKEYLAEARDADAIIAGRKITTNLIDGLESCKIIAVGGVGTDGVDIDSATKKGIPVTNVPDIAPLEMPPMIRGTYIWDQQNPTVISSMY